MLGLLILVGLIALFITDMIVFHYEKYEWSIGIMLGSIAVAYFFQPEIHSFINSDWLKILTWYVPGYLILGFGTAVLKWILYVLKRANKIREIKQNFDLAHPEGEVIYTLAQAAKREEQMKVYKLELKYYNNRINAINLYTQSHDEKLPDGETFPEKPQEPVFDVLTPEQIVENRRRAFVEYYKDKVPYRSTEVYNADYTKETAVVDALTPRAKKNVGLISIWIFQWPVVIFDMLITELLIKFAKNVARLFDSLFQRVSRKLVASATGGL
jgi:hypothetical protein